MSGSSAEGSTPLSRCMMAVSSSRILDWRSGSEHGCSRLLRDGRVTWYGRFRHHWLQLSDRYGPLLHGTEGTDVQTDTSAEQPVDGFHLDIPDPSRQRRHSPTIEPGR